MALANILLHFVIFLHIKLAVMQKPTTGNDNNPTEFNIGGVLSNSDSEDHFRDTIAVSHKAEIFSLSLPFSRSFFILVLSWLFIFYFIFSLARSFYIIFINLYFSTLYLH